MNLKFTPVLLILFSLGLSLSSCQKPLDEEELVYIGSWSSSRHYLEIAANGYGFYQRRNRDPEDCRVRITRRKIIFDWDGGRKSFRIDVPPAIELSTGRVFMVLDGRDFYKH